MSPTDRRWLRVDEASELYGLHPKTLFRLCSQRLIPPARIPSVRGGRGQIRIDRPAFDAMLEAGEVIPTSAPLDRRRRA